VVDAVEEGDRVRRDPDTDVGEIWDSDSLKDLIRFPFSSVLSRDGTALLELWDAARKTWAEEAAGEEEGVEGNGFTVILERALSVLEPVMELKREAASFLVIVTSGGRGEKGDD
jgi:hypothetical protein